MSPASGARISVKTVPLANLGSPCPYWSWPCQCHSWTAGNPRQTGSLPPPWTAGSAPLWKLPLQALQKAASHTVYSPLPASKSSQHPPCRFPWFHHTVFPISQPLHNPCATARFYGLWYYLWRPLTHLLSFQSLFL